MYKRGIYTIVSNEPLTPAVYRMVLAGDTQYITCSGQFVNIELEGKFLRDNGIRTRCLKKLSEGSSEIFDSIRKGHINYVINTIDINQHSARLDGYDIRRCAVENNVTIFTALETVSVLLDVLEEITLGVSTIDAE
jgi:hypothetical protein